ncbi:hypothetical protein [Pedobacter cryotolerans]|uniref:TIGR02646 family protein n=1 Tax=Pedobacter cryotolerans TaxID=2571270 RepID=A0A4U1C7A5_9SPHI|nr:hypothetical protein [Pedobacter cryotolerans]TKC01405.1 hypothetical protein FA045_09215 [Pedobacter cryotolerans]
MRYIDISELEETFNRLNPNTSFQNWVNDANQHLQNIEALSPQQRSTYWRTNNYWRNLYSTLSELSGHKCWYSEAPENSSEWEIEHYRPKAQSKNEDGVIIRGDGYWWLSYFWKNFRLAGSLVNKLRKDRFENGQEVFGKGNFFPLLDAFISQPQDFLCNNESPLLIDPVNPNDVTLISFDSNGDVYPTYGLNDNLINNRKAVLSIKFYGLDHTPIQRSRNKVWQKCETIVDITNNYIKFHNPTPVQINTKISECFIQLVALTRKNEPYTMVVKCFIKEKSKDKNNYPWLENINLVMQ